MRVDESRQERMVAADRSLTWLKASFHFRNGSKGHDLARHHGDGVILEHRVDRCHWQHPAGLYQEIYGFGRHLRKSAEKRQHAVYRKESRAELCVKITVSPSLCGRVS